MVELNNLGENQNLSNEDDKNESSNVPIANAVGEEHTAIATKGPTEERIKQVYDFIFSKQINGDDLYDVMKELEKRGLVKRALQSIDRRLSMVNMKNEKSTTLSLKALPKSLDGLADQFYWQTTDKKYTDAVPDAVPVAVPVGGRKSKKQRKSKNSRKSRK